MCGTCTCSTVHVPGCVYTCILYQYLGSGTCTSLKQLKYLLVQMKLFCTTTERSVFGGAFWQLTTNHWIATESHPNVFCCWFFHDDLKKFVPSRSAFVDMHMAHWYSALTGLHDGTILSKKEKKKKKKRQMRTFEKNGPLTKTSTSQQHCQFKRLTSINPTQ